MSRFPILLLLTFVILFAACGDDSIDPNDEQPITGELDCEQFGYPCSIADTPPEVLEAALDLLDDAWAQRYEGTMTETLTWLENHPDVIEVTGDDNYIRFRIEGCVPVWLTDTTELTNSPPPLLAVEVLAANGKTWMMSGMVHFPAPRIRAAATGLLRPPAKIL